MPSRAATAHRTFLRLGERSKRTVDQRLTEQNLPDVDSVLDNARWQGGHLAMATARCIHLGRVALFACALLSGTSVSRIVRAENPGSPDNEYLDGLRGEWNMVGTTLGKPVRYHAQGERVLQGGFLRLHMVDAATLPKYEADVFIGFDAKAGDYVAHWLDRFGTAGARRGDRETGWETIGDLFPLCRRQVPRHFHLRPKMGRMVVADRVTGGERVMVHVRELQTFAAMIGAKPSRDDR